MADTFHHEDLSRSLLAPQDLQSRELGPLEKSSLGLSPNARGYCIPYYDINGFPISFYRARLDQIPGAHNAPKYKQVKGSSNYVYFPRSFKQTLNGHKYVIMTEGEKKAAAADRQGFPCVAFGGVFSWKSNTVMIPTDHVISAKELGAATEPMDAKPKLEIKFGDGFDLDKLMDKYASGFDELVELIKQQDLTVIIVFDSSGDEHKRTFKGVPYKVQDAASRLGTELRLLGIAMKNIKQIVLPLEGEMKMGLDDFLSIPNGVEKFNDLLDKTLNGTGGFPQCPDILGHVKTKLQAAKITRKDLMQLGLSIVADLDNRGRRLRSHPDGDMFYFDGETKKLHKSKSVTGSTNSGTPILHNSFVELLYQRYNLTSLDRKLNNVLGSQFQSEPTIENVKPRRGVFAQDDAVYYQINNQEYARVSAGMALEVFDNGSQGVMFEAQDVDDPSKELSTSGLVAEVTKQIQEPTEPWWHDTLSQTRIKDPSGNYKKLATLLFYMSPWLNRWKGTQLPVEIVTGEAGSGKSTLYELRLNILTGRTELRNKPKDLQGWHASIMSTGGLHVIDNADLTSDKHLGQLMSDEMCRIVTEPNPTIEMRRYYTEGDLIRKPVNIVFAMTALRLPFRQLDLMQRCFHLSLERGYSDDAYIFDADWANNQLESRGGRLGWIAHHLVVLHKFFQLAKKEWQPRYRAKYRLIHVEQSLRIMARVFGWDDSWIPEALKAATAKASTEVDWILQGLQAYRESYLANLGGIAPSHITFDLADISNWASTHEEFSSCSPLCDLRRLVSYFEQNKALVSAIAGMHLVAPVKGRSKFVFTSNAL